LLRFVKICEDLCFADSFWDPNIFINLHKSSQSFTKLCRSSQIFTKHFSPGICVQVM